MASATKFHQVRAVPATHVHDHRVISRGGDIQDNIGQVHSRLLVHIDGLASPQVGLTSVLVRA